MEEIGRSPVEVGSLSTIIYKEIYIPTWLFGISEPSTVWLPYDIFIDSFFVGPGYIIPGTQNPQNYTVNIRKQYILMILDIMIQ